jgi:multifunctional methyltransferase subunit TRM112
MRLITHNAMRSNTKLAKGQGFPLRITAVEVKVVENPEATHVGQKEIDFVRHMLPVLDWPALVQGASEMGISTLPPQLTQQLSQDPAFLQALYHILMNVHLVKGMLTCPASGREFPVQDGIPNMMLEEEECERYRM